MTYRADPFEVLALAPTLDRGAIKRAYFALLPRHAPHDDPEGFRRLRNAYETLMGPGLHDAWAGAKIDIARELELLERELGERIAVAQQDSEAAEARQAVVRTFEVLLRLDLADARARLAD